MDSVLLLNCMFFVHVPRQKLNRLCKTVQNCLGLLLPVTVPSIVAVRQSSCAELSRSAHASDGAIVTVGKTSCAELSRAAHASDGAIHGLSLL